MVNVCIPRQTDTRNDNWQDLQALVFVPEWAEQKTNVEEDLGDVFRTGSKRNEWFIGLDLRQFRAAFFHAGGGPMLSGAEQ